MSDIIRFLDRAGARFAHALRTGFSTNDLEAVRATIAKNPISPLSEDRIRQDFDDIITESKPAALRDLLVAADLYAFQDGPTLVSWGPIAVRPKSVMIRPDTSFLATMLSWATGLAIIFPALLAIRALAAFAFG